MSSLTNIAARLDAWMRAKQFRVIDVLRFSGEAPKGTRFNGYWGFQAVGMGTPLVAFKPEKLRAVLLRMQAGSPQLTNAEVVKLVRHITDQHGNVDADVFNGLMSNLHRENTKLDSMAEIAHVVQRDPFQDIQFREKRVALAVAKQRPPSVASVAGCGEASDDVTEALFALAVPFCRGDILLSHVFPMLSNRQWAHKHKQALQSKADSQTLGQRFPLLFPGNNNLVPGSNGKQLDMRHRPQPSVLAAAAARGVSSPRPGGDSPAQRITISQQEFENTLRRAFPPSGRRGQGQGLTLTAAHIKLLGGHFGSGGGGGVDLQQVGRVLQQVQKLLARDLSGGNAPAYLQRPVRGASPASSAGERGGSARAATSRPMGTPSGGRPTSNGSLSSRPSVGGNQGAWGAQRPPEGAGGRGRPRPNVRIAGSARGSPRPGMAV